MAGSWCRLNRRMQLDDSSGNLSPSSRRMQLDDRCG